MEVVSRQACVEYQVRSLIEFLLGDHQNVGWLEKHSSQGGNAYQNMLREALANDPIAA
jgi:hypothetical protein